MAGKREEQLKEIMDKLETGVKDMLTSENYATYLKTMSKFHNYSFNNTMLIALQKPDASLVAGYQAWQKKFDRHVKKGEKGIQIIAPAPIREREEVEKIDPETQEPILKENGQPETEIIETVIPRFRVTTVFDVGQTDGKPLPELGAEELTGDVEHYQAFMNAIREYSPVPISFEKMDGDTHGYYSQTEKRIAIKDGMSESQTMKTAIHEVSHALLHDRDLLKTQGVKKDQLTREVEAESVAFSVCQYFGLDSSEYSFPYIASWSSGKEMKELRQSMDTIRKTAGEFIENVAERMKELSKEQSVEQVADEPENSIPAQEEMQYQQVELFGVPALFANERVDESSLPEGIYRYELRGADYDPGYPLTIENHVLVNHAATVLTAVPLTIPEQGHLRLGEELNHVGGMQSIPEFLAEMEGHDFAAEQEKIESAIGRANEKLHLSGAEERYAIYQIDDNTKGRAYKFMRKDYALSHHMKIDASDYKYVYGGKLKGNETLNSLYETFNLNHPAGFTGHSLSVSDVVVLQRDGATKAYYVDSFGFADLPEFIPQRLQEAEMIQKREDSMITMDTSGVEIEQHEGLWHSVDKMEIQDEIFYLMNHNEYGDNVAAVIVNADGELVAQDLEHGFDRGAMEAIREYFAEKGKVWKPELPKVYPHSLTYAMEHGEVDAYLDSRKENIECRNAIAKAISENFDGIHLKHDVVKPVLEAYGSERVAFVLAVTLQKLDHDGRFSLDNKKWAKTIEIEENVNRGMDSNAEYIVESHPAVLDGFINLFRKEAEPEQVQETILENKTVSEEWDIPEETELAFYIPEKDQYLSIQVCEDGYDYTFFDKEYKELDGGVYDNPDISIREAVTELLIDEEAEPDACQQIDYEMLMEKTERVSQTEMKEAILSKVPAVSDRIVSEAALNGMSCADVEETVLAYAQAQIDEMGLSENVELIAARVYGSRTREDIYRENSDLDVVLSYKGDIREDAFFNVLHEEGLQIAGLPVDINPISEEKTGTLEEYLAQAETYLDEKARTISEKRETVQQEPTLTYYVAECMEFPVLGEYHNNLTLQEAVEIYESIPADRMNGIKGIGFDLQDESIYAGEFELMQAGRMDLSILNSIEHYKNSPLVQQAIADIQNAMKLKVLGAELPENHVQRAEQTIEQKQTETKLNSIEKTEDAKIVFVSASSENKQQKTGAKESVLKALRERQAKIKAKEQAQPKEQSQARRKGEQEL